jgi:P2 phage tail completion protein R (GpR)
MRKPDLLRAWLLRAVPDLSDHPDRLHLWIETGRIICIPGATLSYQYRYDLILTVEDFARPADHLIVPLLAWLNDHEPQLLRELGQEGLPINHDILGNASADIEIKLALKERALVSQNAQGGWEVTFPPDPVFPETFVGAESARLLKLYFTNAPHPPELVVAPTNPVP